MSVESPALRIVTFNVLPQAYQLVAQWAEHLGHQIVLVVTTPGPSTRPTPMFRETVGLASAARQDVLVTTRLRRTAAPLIAALAPDLVLSITFPYRIPPEVTTIPRYGALNLHPAPLPKYRGPNPMRAFYDGWPTIGATLHRTEGEFDTGAILSKKEVPLPEDVTPEALFGIWPGLMYAVLTEGVTRAIAGEPGEAQDESEATYAGPYTEAETWISWGDPKRRIQQRVTALNLMGTPGAKALIDGRTHQIQRADPVDNGAAGVKPGTVISEIDTGFLVAVADGVMRVVGTPLDEHEEPVR